MICETIYVGPLETCCYLYSGDEEHLHIIDPGGDADAIIERIEALGIKPSSILLTHAHFDHVAAAARILGRYPNLHIYSSEFASGYMGVSGRQLQIEFLQGLPTLLGWYSQAMKELPEVDRIISEGSLIPDSNLEVFEVPGHTPGCLAYFDSSQNVLFSGDALFHESIGRTDLPGGSQAKLIEMIVTKLFALPPETRVFPGHGIETTIDHEKQYNPFLKKRSSL
jgi:glyoxylase-like metal-dependent hydrolase (beta-lactamase superfamily II)